MSIADGLIVSVSGIRGIVGRSLTPAAALAFASALGGHVERRPRRPEPRRPAQRRHAASRRPGRPDRRRLRGPRHGRGADADRSAWPCGDCKRPAAFRSPPATIRPQWNGLKLFGPDGRVLSAAEGRKVQALFESRQLPRACRGTRLGSVDDYRQAERLALRARPATGGCDRDPRRRTCGASSTPTAAPAVRWAGDCCKHLATSRRSATAATPTDFSCTSPSRPPRTCARSAPLVPSTAPTSVSPSIPTPTGWP